MASMILKQRFEEVYLQVRVNGKLTAVGGLSQRP